MKLHQRTTDWWVRLLREGRLDAWLQRLHQAESGGAARFSKIAADWKPIGQAQVTLSDIIDDEIRHKDLVEVVLIGRRIEVPAPARESEERYWSQVWKGVTSFETACAAGTYGEMLALNRFRVIHGHADTPNDVHQLVARIEPDEARHAFELRRLAGKPAMDAMRPFHEAGKLALGLIAVEDEDED